MSDDLEIPDPVTLGDMVASQVRQHLARHFYGFDCAGGFDVPALRNFRVQVESLARFVRGDHEDRSIARAALNRVLVVCYGSPIGDYPADVPPLGELMTIFRCPSSKSAIGRVVMGALERLEIIPPLRVLQ